MSEDDFYPEDKPKRPPRHEIWKVADALQMDLRAAQAKLVELRAQLSALNLPTDRPECPVCGYRSAMNLPSIREHLRDVHGIDGEAPAKPASPV